MTKRVLYVNPTADISGGENSLWALVQGLDRSQFDPLLICPSEGRLTERARVNHLAYRILPTQQLSLTGSPFEVLFDVARALPAARRWRDLIARENIDLVHINSYRIAVACSLGARMAHRPVIWHVRDIPTSLFKRRVLGLLALNLSDRIIAVSEAVGRIFDNGVKRSRQVRVIYNGIQIENFRPTLTRVQVRDQLGVAGDTVLVGNVGQLVPWKGYELLLQAISRLQSQGLDLCTVIVGESISPGFRVPQAWRDYKKRLLKLSETLNLGTAVRFLGFREDIPNLMGALDIYAHSAIWPDPLPRSILEAMASQLAIIAPEIGGVPEMICHRESGYLYPAGNVEALAAGIATLAGDAEQRRTLGQAARTRCRAKFSLEGHLAQVQTLYREVLDESRH